MATISSLGIGSGLDSESIVTKLVALEKQPLASLQNKATIEKAQISAFGQIQSEFSALADAASALTSTSAWVARTASSSNASIATITATSAAVATSFTLDVDQLAKPQAVSSASITRGTYVGSGTMTLRLGTWSNATNNNTGSNSADVALAAAQTALDTATSYKTTADATLLTATQTKTIADAAYNQAVLDAASPDAALALANATLATKTAADTTARSDLASANALVVNQTSAFNVADAALTLSSTTLAAKTTANNNATTALSAQTLATSAATGAASTALNDPATGAIAGAAKLAAYAASPGTASIVKNYSDAYTNWTNAVAANDHVTPALQAAEDAAFSAKGLAYSALGFYDAANSTTTQTDVAAHLTGFTDPTEASTLKGTAAVQSALLVTATATKATALNEFNLATSDQSTKSTAQANAQNALTAATTAQGLAVTAASTAAGELTAATTAQQSVAATAAPFDAALTSAITTRDAAQATFDLATTAATQAAAAVTTANTTLTNAQNAISGSRPVFTQSISSSDVAIAVTATDTVATLAAKINAANAGVVATTFYDGTADRLQLTSKGTGTAAGFRIQVTDTGDGNNTDNAGLSRLAFDPQASAYGMASPGLVVTYGQDAKARINGVAVTSQTNTFENNFTGVSITALATTTANYNNVGGTESRSPLTMAVKEDVTPAVKNVQSFITAYNALASDLANVTKYDAATKTPSIFQADASILAIQSVLRNMVGSISNGSVYKRLSDVGVERQIDGTLSMNTSKLSVAANNGTELLKLFTTDNKDPQTNGFALKFSVFAKGVLASGGSVTNKALALQKQLDVNAKEQTKVNDKATAVEARLRKQYSALDGKMAGLSALNAYVAQQVTTWNKSGA
jgi:flagellar hook-associated protein 2